MIGGQGRHRAGHTALEIALVAGDFQRREVWEVRRARAQPAPAAAVGHVQLIGVVVFVRPGQTKRRNRTHDQTGVELAKGVVADAPLSHLGGRIIVDHNVGPGDELGKPVLVLSQVERDAALIGIQGQEQAALFRIDHPAGERPALPGQVSARFFDLDHIGSQVSHDLAGV